MQSVRLHRTWSAHKSAASSRLLLLCGRVAPRRLAKSRVHYAPHFWAAAWRGVWSPCVSCVACLRWRAVCMCAVCGCLDVHVRCLRLTRRDAHLKLPAHYTHAVFPVVPQSFWHENRVILCSTFGKTAFGGGGVRLVCIFQHWCSVRRMWHEQPRKADAPN